MRVRTADSDLKVRVQRLAQRGRDLHEVKAGIDQTLRESVGYDVASISTIDPATGLATSGWQSGIEADPALERAVSELECVGKDVNHYHDLARAGLPVARLHAATRGDLTSSHRFVELLEPLGVIDEMRVVARSRDTCWGTLALYRTAPSGSPFTDRDAHVVAQSAALIADLLRLSLLRAAVESPDAVEQPPGLLLVAADGAIEATTPRAAAWLDALDDRARGPSAVRVVARAAMAGDGLARAALAARDGRWIELHSSVRRDADGDASGPVEVIIEGARPVQLSDTIARAHGFTGREREVAGLVARGRTIGEMTEILGVSELMVRDNARAVFAKTQTTGRGELAAFLLARYYEPRNAAGATPGPYGWYLEPGGPNAP